jgi:uncharacterized protein with HEPN domain
MPPETLKLLEVLIHGYDAIDHSRVWDAIQNSLPQLLARVETLLSQAQPP